MRTGTVKRPIQGWQLLGAAEECDRDSRHTALEALNRAQGVIAVRVGMRQFSSDGRLAGPSNGRLWEADASAALHQFALWCAEEVLKSQAQTGSGPYPTFPDALAAKEAWLRGALSDDELAAHREELRTAPIPEMAALRQDAIRKGTIAACLTAPLAAARQAALAHGLTAYYHRTTEGGREVALAGARRWQDIALDRLLSALAPKPQAATR
ncbi:MAG: hypothetical protein NTZ05_20690 [Chloroflexi bacterium]|nr:hypothetical protein [Chloroflexota bacterium]